MAGLWSLQQKVSIPFLPVTTAQFARSLLKIWRPSTTQENGKELPTIGLAISGGVDSMALALLCSRLKYLKSCDEDDSENTVAQDWESIVPRLGFRAFVVDHGARPGSHDEAEAVAAALAQDAIGIPTTILKLSWQDTQRPSQLPNFETQARKHRFRLLGQACKQHGIDSLLLAHHEDDQAETVMMRLVRGHRTSGLIGIKSQAAIPECYGIHGVHESGGLNSQEHDNITSTAYKRSSNQPQSEAGGIRMYRPLLDFAKKDLISTCQASQISWFEDHTNIDSTVTGRNSVRHLFANYSLPVALRKTRLLALAKRSAENLKHREERSREWLAHCEVIEFNKAVGTVTIDIPDLVSLEKLSGELSGKTGVLKAQFLREIVRLVSPNEHQAIDTLHKVADLFFRPRCGGIHRAEPFSGFTVAGVQFQPISYDPVPKSSSIGNTTTQNTQRWFLARQPYTKIHATPSLTFPSNGNTWSPWLLYDGRFWIRVQNSTNVDLVVRPLLESDEKNLKKFLLSQPGGERIFKNIRKAAPGIVRRTLPVLVPADGDVERIGIYVLGFHTLAADVGVKWEVRYKKVYTESLNFRLSEV